MTCKNCGEQLPENVTLCPKCGTENNEEIEISAAGGERAIPRGFSSKKNIIIIIIAAVLLIIGSVTAIAVTNYNSVSSRAERGIELAERYLNEQNYEQAIIEFQKVLEIDPMNVDAYLGMANTYKEMGNIDKAVEILQEGLEKTDDERIRQRLDELIQESEPVYGSMGSVTIAGTEVDVATTKSLFIYNKERYESGNWRYNDISQRESQFDYVIYLKNSLSGDDMNAVSKLINLQKLEIDYADISDITYFSNLTDLTELCLPSNQISDITPIVDLKNLHHLTLNNNQINDVTPLADLTDLINLDLIGNQISNISPLADIISLKGLLLGSNQISDITTLASLTGLTSLDLSFNQINDITPLADLHNLQKLYLQSNQISNIMPLTNFADLTDLWLDHNQISDITPLSELTNLTRLNLWHNQISNITPLVNLTNLTILHLGDNQIDEKDITQLKNQLPNCEINLE